MFVLEICYRRSAIGGTWEARMNLKQIPSGKMDPCAGIPVLEVCTDGNIVAYTIPLMGVDGPRNEFLSVVAHEIITGRTTRIRTDIKILDPLASFGLVSPECSTS